MKDNNGNPILCEYGCGQEASYIMSNGKFCCCEHYNKCPGLRKRNSSANKKRIHEQIQNHTYVNPFETFILEHGSWNKGVTKFNADTLKNMKYIVSSDIIKLIKRNLIDLKYECGICHNQGIWQNKVLTLELHHKDGNHFNNDLSNLVFLCPNCHSQTDSYRNRRNTTKHKKHLFVEKLLCEHLHEYNTLEEFISAYQFNNKSKVYQKYIQLTESGQLHPISQKGNT